MMKQFKTPIKFLVLLLLLNLVSTKPTSELHNGKSKISTDIQLDIAKKVFKAIQDLKTFQKEQSMEAVGFIETKALEIQNNLSTLPEQCSQEISDNINKQKNEVLKQLSLCNTKEIIYNAIHLGLETVEFAMEMTVDGALIFSNFIACVSSSAHVSFTRAAACVFKVMAIFPEEVKEIINETKNFANAIIVLLPQIENDIKSCFSSSKSSFQQTISSIADDVSTCKKSFKKT
uniref:Protein TsetseEP domain-containing protein n=1 Tax=Graphocephala atropunctata TaxID=36148 RepID=A0A1B6LLR0_9HEMI